MGPEASSPASLSLWPLLLHRDDRFYSGKLAEVEAKTANRYITGGSLSSLHTHICISFYGALLLSWVPWDLPYLRKARASQMELGRMSGMNCFSCP